MTWKAKIRIFSLLIFAVLFCVGSLFGQEHSVAFFAFSPNSAKHFAVFSKKLQERGISSYLFLGKEATSSIEGAHSFNQDEVDLEIEKILEEFPKIDRIVTEISHPLSIHLHEVFSKIRPNVRRVAYYDNPESFVPGGYSSRVGELCKSPVQEIVFANMNLASTEIYSDKNHPIDFSNKTKRGLGYYPTDMAEKIQSFQQRDIRRDNREKIFASIGLEDTNQKIFVYTGGANAYYFSQAWPFFLELAARSITEEDKSSVLILLQQHPRACIEGNPDGKALSTWKQKHPEIASVIQVSTLKTEEALGLADGVFYSQTSMAPLFLLAGIPTAQVGFEPLDDLLIRNQMCPVISTNREFIKQRDASSNKSLEVQSVYQKLGLSVDWESRLLDVFCQ